MLNWVMASVYTDRGSYGHLGNALVPMISLVPRPYSQLFNVAACNTERLGIGHALKRSGSLETRLPMMVTIIRNLLIDHLILSIIIAMYVVFTIIISSESVLIWLFAS